MLKLITLDEREELVLTSDPAVLVKGSKDEDPTVVRLRSVKVASNQKPTVFKVRALNSRERMQIAEASSMNHAQALFSTCEMAILEINDGKNKAKQGKEVSDLLLRLPAECVYGVAGWVLDHTNLSDDPLDASA